MKHATPDIPRPRSASAPSEAPSSVTFFLTGAQRAAVLKHLRKVHPNPGTALLRALRITTTRRTQ